MIKPEITIEDFAKVDIRVGVIEKAEPHTSGTKLLVLTVDFGSIGKRTICAGIREFVKNNYESLVGRRFLFVVNLPPRAMRGIESQGMILAAATDDHKRLMLPEASACCMITEDRALFIDEVLIPAGSAVG